jgi:hypothetical protein
MEKTGEIRDSKPALDVLTILAKQADMNKTARAAVRLS